MCMLLKVMKTVKREVTVGIGRTKESILETRKENWETLIEKDHLGDWSPEKDCC